MSIILALIAAAALCVVACQGWLIVQLLHQQRRLHHRLDGIAKRLARPMPPESDARLAPTFTVPSLAGTATSLTGLLTAGTPLILTFTDPRCGPCYDLLPDIGGWQRVYGDRLAVALVSGGSVEQNRALTAEYGIMPGSVLIQADREIAGAYGVRMAPAAVLIHPDGRLEGKVVYGAPAVRVLVADTLGLALPESPAREIATIGPGQRVPALRRPDLAGNPLDLGAPSGTPTLLLFWSPGCHHCQDLLPEIRSWEAWPDGPRLIVVSNGPAALNQEAGLRSPMILDDDRSLAMLFGASGTPAAVVIDHRGLVVSQLSRGATDVRALAAHLFRSIDVAA